MRRLLALFAFVPVVAYGSLDGLWASRRDFGPDVRGTLRLAAGRAEIAGRSAPVNIDRGDVTFALPNGEGRFRGAIRGLRIIGHWIQPAGIFTGGAEFATPVILSKTATVCAAP